MLHASMPSLLVDNGDVNKGYGRQPELKYETALKAMSQMGYDAANVGEEDLLLGLDYLKYVADFVTTPLISANITDPAGAPVFKEYVLRDISTPDTKISAAIIGIISPEFNDTIQAVNPELSAADYRPILDHLVHRLRPQVDLLILLAHTSAEEASAIAREHPQFDLIIASHNGDDPMSAPERENGVPIGFAGTNGMHVGQATFFVTDHKAKLHEYSMVKLEGTYADSPQILALLEDYQQMLRAEHVLDAYPRSETGGFTYTGNQKCKRCHSLPSWRYRKDKHAHAFKAIVEKRHEYDPECVRCHTVGFGYITGFMSPDKTPALQDVGCEDCHGPGSDHVERPMQTDYGTVTKETCETCHNVQNSPKFVYDEYIKKIRHNPFFLCSAKICHWFR